MHNNIIDQIHIYLIYISTIYYIDIYEIGLKITLEILIFTFYMTTYLKCVDKM